MHSERHHIRISHNIPIMLNLAAFRRRKTEDSAISSPEEALQLLDEITVLTDRIRKTPGLEEGKVEEIEKGIEGIFRNYSNMNPRRPTRFLRDLNDVVLIVENAYKEGVITEKQRKILEITIKKMKMRDFYSARRLLMKFSKPIEVKKERDFKLDQYRSYHKKLENQSKELEDEIEKAKRVPQPELSTSEIKEAENRVKEYNAAAAGAFVNFIAQAPCVDAISMALRASSIQDLGFPAPKDRESIAELIRLLKEENVCKAFGSENLTKLVEVAGFSDKRLEHFVKDYKWFQRKLQENSDWLSEVTTQGRRTLEIQWLIPADAMRARIDTLMEFLKSFPNADRAVNALSILDKMLKDSTYESVLKSLKIYKTYGNMAVTKFKGDLSIEIKDLEDDLADVKNLLEKLPPLDRLTP